MVMEFTVDMKNKKFYNLFLYFLESLHIEIVSNEKRKDQKKISLKGMLVKFENPFDPATDALDWDAAK